MILHIVILLRICMHVFIRVMEIAGDNPSRLRVYDIIYIYIDIHDTEFIILISIWVCEAFYSYD